MARLDEQPVVEEISRPLVGWGAVFAGLVFVLASSSLMFLLGSALGLGVADVTEGAAVGDGLGIAAVVWMLVTSIITFFLGSLLAARLNGRHDDAAGTLTGVTLWSIGTVLLAWLATAGTMGAAKAGGSAIDNAMAMTASVVTAVGAAGAGAAGALEDTSIGNRVAAMVKAELARQVSETQTPANRAPADQGTGNQAPGQPDTQNRTGGQTGPAENSVADPQEVQQAIDQIDVQALQDIGMALVRGDTEGAKSLLALNTNLSEQEVDSIIDGASREAEQTVNEAKQKLAEATEAATNYTQAAIWAAFVSGALGLVVSIVGGMLGARTTKRLYLVRTV